eukprot:5697432-Amphidinium_carterae.1
MNREAHASNGNTVLFRISEGAIQEEDGLEEANKKQQAGSKGRTQDFSAGTTTAECTCNDCSCAGDAHPQRKHPPSLDKADGNLPWRRWKCPLEKVP